MAAKKQYSCPNRKCKKKITALVPSPKAVGSKGFWDGVTVCPHCGQAHFKRVWPGGKIVIVVEDITIETESDGKISVEKLKALKPGELAKRAGISADQQKELNSGAGKLVKKPAAVTPVVKFGLYYQIYDNGSLRLVMAGEQLKGFKEETFEGTCIFDNGRVNQTGKFAENWNLKLFTHIPFNPEIYRHLEKISQGKKGFTVETLAPIVLKLSEVLVNHAEPFKPKYGNKNKNPKKARR